MPGGGHWVIVSAEAADPGPQVDAFSSDLSLSIGLAIASAY